MIPIAIIIKYCIFVKNQELFFYMRTEKTQKETSDKIRKVSHNSEKHEQQNN